MNTIDELLTRGVAEVLIEADRAMYADKRSKYGESR